MANGVNPSYALQNSDRVICVHETRTVDSRRISMSYSDITQWALAPQSRSSHSCTCIDMVCATALSAHYICSCAIVSVLLRAHLRGCVWALYMPVLVHLLVCISWSACVKMRICLCAPACGWVCVLTCESRCAYVCNCECTSMCVYMCICVCRCVWLCVCVCV